MLSLVLAPALALAAPPPAQTCALPQTTPTAQHAPARVQKLGDLPDAQMDLAVIRRIDGCWVKEVVRFNVSERGPNGALTATIPTPGYRGRLVPEGPAPRTTPAR